MSTPPAGTPPPAANDPPPAAPARARWLQRWRPRARLAIAALGLWIIGAGHIAVVPLAPLTRLDLEISDLRRSLALAPVPAPRDDIVIVDIDDASLHALGRWPWPRDRLAQLVTTLFDEDHAAALGIDLLLSEPDDQAPAVREALDALTGLAPNDAALQAGVARWQGRLEARADHDALLAAALAGHPVTLAYHFNHVVETRTRLRGTNAAAAASAALELASDAAGRNATAAATAATARVAHGPGDGRRRTHAASDADAPTPDLTAPDLPPPLTEPGVLPASALAMTPWQGIEPPVPALMAAAGGLGFINSLPDADGELRSTPLVTAYGGAVYESFGLSLWRQWHQVSAARPVTARGAGGGALRLVGLQLADAQGEPLRALRVDERGAVTLPYRRAIDPGASPGTGRFRYIPAADVLAHRVGMRELAGRVVLLGSSAPGLADLRATPVHSALPGIEVHAQLLAGLEDADLSVRPDWSPGFELLLLAAVLAAVAAAARQLAGPAAVVALVGIAAAVLFGDLLALVLRGWAIPIAAPLVGGTLLGVGGVVGNYLNEWQSRRTLAQLFGHYLPPERVRAMASDPGRFLDIASSAENRELTVLFCDLRGFTPMAEHLAPERLREILNLYFSRMSEIIHAHDGTLDKFIGDAVMAFWGAPQADALHAAHAVQAALAMGAAVGPLNAELAARGLPPLAPCIGLATGVVCVGDLGSALRRSYTAVGDGVNLAARVEGLTRGYAVPLLVADTTRAAAGELPGCEWIEVDEVGVKGRSQLVTLFVPLPVPVAAPPLVGTSSTAEDGPGNAAEINRFHEQLGLWRLAREALRGHHGDSSQPARRQAARAVARARLVELLDARPVSPQLHALAAHGLATLAAQDAAEQDQNPDPSESHTA